MSKGLPRQGGGGNKWKGYCIVTSVKSLSVTPTSVYVTINIRSAADRHNGIALKHLKVDILVSSALKNTLEINCKTCRKNCKLYKIKPTNHK